MKQFSRVLSHDLNKQDNEVSYYEALITHNIVMSHLCGDVPNLVHLTVHMQITLNRRRIRSTAFSHARLPG